MIRMGQRHLAVAWGLCLCLIALCLWVRLENYRFDASLLSLLPTAQQHDLGTQRAALANKHLTDLLDRELLLLVGAPDADTSAEWAARIQSAIASPTRQPQTVDATDVTQFSEAYFPHRYFLLAEQDRALLRDSPDQLLRRAQQQLYSPMGAGYQPIADSFWLFQNFLQSLAEQSPLSVQDGWPTLTHEGRVYRLVRFRLQGEAFDANAQAGLADLIDQLQAQLPTDVTFFSSGLVVHAAYGARMARQEISTVGLGSLIGVLALLWMSLGRGSVIALLSCVGAGLLLAMTVSVWWFESLHLITLAFGATLIGVGIDYGIHARVALASGERLRVLLPALLLGLVTSLLAYGIQGTMPFPGLQQMALFSCVGLLGAWLSACLWLPLLTDKGVHPRKIFQWVHHYWSRVPALPLKPQWVALLLIAALALFWQLPGDDRLSNLQTSPASLVAQEQTFQQLLQRGSKGQYFLVAADSEAELDARLMALNEQLAVLQGRGLISDFQSLHDWRPALERQWHNRALQESLYQTQGQSWFESLGAPALANDARQALVESAQPLTLARWSAQMPQPQFFFKSTEELFAIVPVQGVIDASSVQALSADNIHYVDRPATVAGLLSHYRLQLQHWTAVAIVLALSLLVWRLGWSALPLLAVPVLAAITVATVLSLWFSLTLFHCLALLLVLGIGFDSCIFLLAGAQPKPVWYATSLSVLTSGISFGLLALSETPVLHFFGLTVLMGLLLVWSAIPSVYKGLATDRVLVNRADYK
ncbi:MMPL family transporter [Simiduia aestuariiviva]|uniref:Putative exporter n=1 Tax=Simiduia aestuariiviva TaxID=1510459 RepID=A0A839US09_9GAMM|nr:hypothetical protein [Simiduia aestuariiviva]MBB3169249.1 putative exporter [Simiduia aestuariiviva]